MITAQSIIEENKDMSFNLKVEPKNVNDVFFDIELQ